MSLLWRPNNLFFSALFRHMFFFFFFFFYIRVFFNRHWQHLFATLHVRWLSHIFNRKAHVWCIKSRTRLFINLSLIVRFSKYLCQGVVLSVSENLHVLSHERYFSKHCFLGNCQCAIFLLYCVFFLLKSLHLFYIYCVSLDILFVSN